jgi:hypothetical protein
MKRYSAEEKGMWVEDWKASGKSLWVYAKENGLNGQTFRNWTTGPEKASGFVEISPVAQEEPLFEPEILIEKGDIKIHLPLVIKGNELRAVMQSLGWEI